MDLVSIPFAAHEAEMMRKEKTEKRLFAIILILILLLVGTNAGWLIYESQFEYITTETQEVVQEAENGTNNFVGGDIIGETNS